MDRRLLFPAVVATAWAQQTSPATAEAEKALRARAEQFLKLEVDKKFRQAEAFVAEDTKDYFYENGKPEITNFRIDHVEFVDATHAKINVLISTTLRAPGFPAQELTNVPVPQNWKLENGEWVWYFLANDVIDTPFGPWHMGTGVDATPMPPGMPKDASNLEAMIVIDRTSVDLIAGSQKAATVTITNHLPGVVSIEIGADRPQGLTVAIDKTQLGRNEKAVISFGISGNARPSGTVRIKASPVQEFIIQIRTR